MSERDGILADWFESIIERARRSYANVYQSTGQPPSYFLVSAREYAWLGGTTAAQGHDQIRIFGVPVMTPQRVPWDRAAVVMEHPRVPRVLSACDDIRPSIVRPSLMEHCRTDRPAHPQLSVTCPCGEVIWDLSTCRWGAVRPSLLRFTYTPHEPDPLPPLDDLDEGLQCCGADYATFASFIVHQRQQHPMGA